jgi:hypothetical protein
LLRRFAPRNDAKLFDICIGEQRDTLGPRRSVFALAAFGFAGRASSRLGR